MDQELKNFIQSIESKKNGDKEMKKLLRIVKVTDGKCPECNKHDIALGLLKNLKILSCRYCEWERRQHGIPATEVRQKQIINYKETLGAI